MYKQHMSLIFDSYAYSRKQVKIKDNTSSVELDRSIVYPLCIHTPVQLVIEPRLTRSVWNLCINKRMIN